MNYEEAYEKLHGCNKHRFSGYSIKPYVDDIAELVESHGAKRLLDYGSGKGYQYLKLRVHERWGGILPYCYDPGVKQLRAQPEGLFDGIICTDVMEHIEEADVVGVFETIFGYAEPGAFLFFCIACRPSLNFNKRLPWPDGRDVHVTIKPPAWWDRQLKPFRRDGLTLRVVYDQEGVINPQKG